MNQVEDYKAQIFDLFDSWASQSKAHCFPAMSALTQAKSTFHQLTYSCHQSCKRGTSYHYEFDKLIISHFSMNEPEIIIKGLIELHIPKIDVVYHGSFISSAYKANHEVNWKLKDIEIDWQ